MIDFIKLSSRLNNAQDTELKSRVDFNGMYNESTGELVTVLPNGKRVSKRSTAWIKNMKIVLFPNRYIEVAGSIHKYFNDGKHNFNQFGKKELKTAVNSLIEASGLDLLSFKVDSVEIGVNLTPPIASDDIIDNALMYKRKPFSTEYHKNEGNYKQAFLSEYLVKLYNKRKHYEKDGYAIDKEILRFELKINKMRMLAKYKVYCLEDLIDNLQYIKEMLPKAWDEVLLYDPTMKKEIKEKTIKYANVNFWKGIAGKKNRSYNYNQRKLYSMMEGNTCAIQAKVKDVMVKTLDCLV